MFRVVVIGCCKEKRYIYERRRGGRVLPAELYQSQLFRKRVAYAERNCLPWGVLSALFGFWRSDTELKPTTLEDPEKAYDTTLGSLLPAERSIWPAQVAYKLLHQLWDHENITVDYELDGIPPNEMLYEIHAGKDYAHPLAEILQSCGVNVEIPCKGLGIGEQLKYYTDMEKADEAMPEVREDTDVLQLTTT